MAARSRLTVTALCILAAATVTAEEETYPLMATLDRGSLLFHQIQGDVEAFHLAQARAADGAVPPSLLLFRYRLDPNDDIGSVAARLGIGQATLATLNRAATPGEFQAKPEVLVANLPGVFVPDANRTDFESELAAPREQASSEWLPIVVTHGGARVGGRFYLGDAFTPGELVRFFQGFFRGPVAGGRISSRFGLRMSPFGRGSTMHTGIDIVAGRGAAVFAAQSGTVTDAAQSPRYGNYVMITHAHGYQTMYAHLATVDVTLRQAVESGTILGTVGDTGQTTGVHLHFEIRHQGVPIDPIQHLPREWNRR